MPLWWVRSFTYSYAECHMLSAVKLNVAMLCLHWQNVIGKMLVPATITVVALVPWAKWRQLILFWRHDIRHNDTQHNDTQHKCTRYGVFLCWVSVMPNVIHAECHKYALYAECHYDECHYAECRLAECHGAYCFCLMLQFLISQCKHNYSRCRLFFVRTIYRIST